MRIDQRVKGWPTRGMRATLATGLAVTILLGPYYPLGQRSHRGTWRTEPRIATARQALAMIPDGAVVAASNRLAPHLTDRATVTLLDPRELPNVDWIAEDSADDDAFPLTPAQRDQLIVAARNDGFRVVLNRDGHLFMHR